MYVDIHYILTKQVRQVTVILYYSSHYLLLNLIPFFFSSDENNEYISLILSMEIDNRKRIRRFYTFYWYDTTPNIVI